MNRTLRHLGMGATLSLLLSTTAMAATSSDDAEIAALKAQLKAMSARLEALEQKPAAAPAATTTPQTTTTQNTKGPTAGSGSPQIASTTVPVPAGTAVKGEGQPVVGGSVPGSFKLPGTETSIKFGGYVKLDAIEDVNHSYGGQYANFATIPLNNSAAAHLGSQFNMQARQSRLNMETHTPTSIGDLKTFMEVDFFGSARGNANTTNGEGLQLRQAYGQVGHILAGQTWSNFMDMDAYPESLDYIGPAGLTFNRNPQIRYTGTDGQMTYSAAIESANTDFTAPTANDVSLSQTPDFTVKAEYKDAKLGNLAVRGLLRDLHAANTVSQNENTDIGWGVGVSGKLLAYDKDSAFFQGVYGDGVGRYLFDVANSTNGSAEVNGNIEAQKAWGGYLGYQHYWNKDWRSNIMAGYTGIDNDVALTGTGVNKEVASGHLNLIWSPDPAYRVGVEYMHGYREIESGVKGELDRVQTSLMYIF